MKVLAVVVNYRTAEMTLRAVRALLAALDQVPDSEVVIVDNDSRDGSFERLSLAARTLDRPGRVTVVPAEKNGGFGYGVNLGIRHGLQQSSPPEFFYLLNSDAFPDPSAVRELVEVFEREPRAGIAGSYIYGIDGLPHVTAFRFPSPMGELERALRLGLVSKLLGRWRVAMPVPDSDCVVDWVAGASMMIRREVFSDVGLFDETFFLYFEETDFCRRAKQRGWSTYYVRRSAVAHIGGASTGVHQHSKRRIPEYWFDSRQHYFKKNHGEAYLTLSDLLFALGFSLWRVRRRLQRKADEDPPELLYDFLRHSWRSRVLPSPPATTSKIGEVASGRRRALTDAARADP
ncbi:MAG TPA: glycosyltransferase family 2 protein [Polyangiaceae bacterium]